MFAMPPPKKRSYRKRFRKNRDQMEQLKIEYEKNPKWTREYVIKLAEKLKLTTTQVYKWQWDQTKKVLGPQSQDMPPME